MSRKMQSPFSWNFIKRFSPALSILFENSSQVSPVKVSSVLTSPWESRMYAKFLQHAPQPLHTCVDESLVVFINFIRLYLAGYYGRSASQNHKRSIGFLLPFTATMSVILWHLPILIYLYLSLSHILHSFWNVWEYHNLQCHRDPAVIAADFP